MTDIRPTALCFLLALNVLNGCSGRPATNTATANQTPGAVPANQTSSATTAGGTSAAATANQASTAAVTAQPGEQTVTGTVVETMDASSYTYVRVKTGSGELWAAASQFKVAEGDRVVVPLEGPMQNFHSQTLNRDFPLIYFASLITREGESAPPAMAAGHSQLGGRPPGAEAAPVTEIVAPAEGGTTVAKVWATRKALAGKKVTVRGKVVKFNGGILGKNWVHLQDGTGTAADGTHDLTVTTTAMTRVGDVITATGTIAVGKDLGSGYSYAVILEDAAILAK